MIIYVYVDFTHIYMRLPATVPPGSRKPDIAAFSSGQQQPQTLVGDAYPMCHSLGDLHQHTCRLAHAVKTAEAAWDSLVVNLKTSYAPIMPLCLEYAFHLWYMVI